MKRIYFYGMLGLVIVSAATGRCEACETAPVAEIVSPSSGHAACVGCAVSFDAVGSGSTGSHDPDNGEPAGGGHGITKYEWHWGDEGPGDPYWHNAGGTPSHTYSTGGSYTVWLRVTDDDSPSQTDTTSCTVHAVRVLSIVSKDVACVNEDITFTVTTDPAGHEGPVTWSGGETPATGSGKTFTTRWSTVGPKQVTAECGSSSVSKTIDVIDGLTVLPREAYVCVDDTKWFKAWGCAGGVATDVTSVATFSTSNGSMQTGGGSPSGPGNNILHPSSGSSCEKTCDWVKATYNSVTTDDDHDCDLTVVEVTITDWAGNPITTTQTVCVGQKISLKGKVEPSTMTGTWQWIIPGTVVKDYKKEPLSGPPAGRTKAWVVPLTAADKEQSTIEFYWVDGGDGRGVTLTWTESSGEISCSDDAGFDVKRPSLDSFTSETGPRSRCLQTLAVKLSLRRYWNQIFREQRPIAPRSPEKCRRGGSMVTHTAALGLWLAEVR